MPQPLAPLLLDTSSKKDPPNHVYDQERIAGVVSENAVLVRVILPGQHFEDDPLEELEGLAKTAGTTVVAGLTQRRDKPDVTAFVGKGKLEDLKLLVEMHGRRCRHLRQ
jgi:GTP-binding protein HflX